MKGERLESTIAAAPWSSIAAGAGGALVVAAVWVFCFWPATRDISAALASWVQAVGSIAAIIASSALAISLPRRERAERKRELQLSAVACAQVAADHALPSVLLLEAATSRSILAETGFPHPALEIADQILAGFPTGELGDPFVIQAFPGIRGSLSSIGRLADEILDDHRHDRQLDDNLIALWHAADALKELVVKLGQHFKAEVRVDFGTFEELRAAILTEAKAKAWPVATGRSEGDHPRPKGDK